MKSAERVLLLVGSPKRKRSTSFALGNHLLSRLREHGFETEIRITSAPLKPDTSGESLLDFIHQADIVILAFPLYVDSLPYPVIRILEDIAEYRRKNAPLKDQRLLAIVNCGFPEAHQNHTALAICRQFAMETGFQWAGGLGLGGGGIINGTPLPRMKGVTRWVIKSLNMTADALASGKPMPPEAVSLMAKPMIPNRMYLFFAGRSWRRTARKHGVLKNLDDRPYLKQGPECV